MRSLLSGGAALAALRSARPRRRRALPCVAAALALFTPAAASAYDVLAAPCADDPLHCASGAVTFQRKEAIPLELDFDTGWVPPGSPLQVSLGAAVYANTQVALSGALEASWPEALALRTPGAPDGGAFSCDYGLDVSAQGRFSVSVLGQDFDWTGDIPYVPQIDFQIHGREQFDAWGWEPGITLESSTDLQRIASVSLGDLIGGSIPGIDGRFELDVAMDVAARYTTHRVAIETLDQATVSGGDVTSEGQASSTAYLGGPSVELNVRPEGSVRYDGTLHLVPAFGISLLGRSWSIPIADIPLAFPFTEREWAFESERVHVPLPDLALDKQEIDFGAVDVGQANVEIVKLSNAGEALLDVAVTTDDPESFELADAALGIDPESEVDFAIRFAPKASGEFSATVLVESNDPDRPAQVITVRGIGIGEPDAPADDGALTDEDGGCACRAAGGARREGAGGGASAAAGLSLAALAGVLRRRRRAA
ncbi:choice-of-anchor D domain-containing protein [Sorangium sp. So ce1000]|uniref:choice-of-anchor D domain-containing protein n=1 Tax=Sorangium sp. So ce1000 TaxID=3133325 RepID=UPI003F62CE71